YQNWSEYENTLTHLNNLTDITIYLLSSDGHVEGIISENDMALQLYIASYNRLKKTIQDACFKYPAFLSEEHGTSYFSIKMPYGILLCGPIIHMKIKESSYIDQFEQSELSVAEKLRYIDSYAHTPVIDYKHFTELAVLLNNLINKQNTSLDSLVQNKQLFNLKENTKSFSLSSDKNAQPPFPFDFKNTLIEAMHSGDSLILTNSLKQMKSWRIELASRSPLKSSKLSFAVFAGLIMNESVNAGLDGNLAMRLCEHYVDWADRARNIEEIYGTFIKMLYDYTDKFYKQRKRQLSKLSVEFEKYVYSKANERISLAEAAETLNVSPQYLCKKVKEDFGVSPNKIIHKIKTKEAKRILKAREMPLSEIWLHLGYCDQSHFNKVFKQYIGITPSEYLQKS
ncbi:MAG TPA: AraC family transcriptional regulator, partial [Clostridia bacterium]|nr:AraC family transcriptional regulator [Clostridia bacterium]